MKLLVIIFGALLLLSSVNALQNPDPVKPTISIGSYQVNLNSTQVIPIVIKNARSIAGGSVNITFSRSVLKIMEVSAGDFPMITSNVNNSRGFLVISAISATASEEDEAILANVAVKGVSVGESPLVISSAELSYGNGSLIIPNLENGSVKVLGATATTIQTITSFVTLTATTITSTVTSPITVVRYFTNVVTKTLEKRATDVFPIIAAAGLTAMILTAIFLIIVRRLKRPKVIGVK